MNFVFHVDEGRIIGAAAYPVRDRFQFTRVGSLLNLHGPVHWFNRHSYLPLGQSSMDAIMGGGSGEGASAIVVFCQFFSTRGPPAAETA